MSLRGGPQIQTGGDLKTNSQAGFKNKCSKADLTLALPISCHFTIHRFFSELKTDRESNLRLGALHALFCWQNLSLIGHLDEAPLSL